MLDLGCGEGQLEEELRKKHIFKDIKSYDLVALKPHVIEKDIKNLPHEDGSVDLATFCLSLMGTNYVEFILEASRYINY